MFALKRAKMNQNFRFFFKHFHSALAILDAQIYVVVEQFVADNNLLLSGRLVDVYVANGLTIGTLGMVEPVHFRLRRNELKPWFMVVGSTLE